MVVEADAPEIAVGVDGEALLPATPVVCGIPPGLAVVVALVPACGAGYGCHRMVAHAFDDTPQSS